MEKLLHERLKESAHEGYSTKCAIDEVIGRDCDKFEDCDECAKNALKKLADEIERYYIPRPRFEDGEPVQFGDSVSDGVLFMEEPVDAILHNEDGSFSIYGKEHSIFYGHCEHVKRP